MKMSLLTRLFGKPKKEVKKGVEKDQQSLCKNSDIKHK